MKIRDASFVLCYCVTTSTTTTAITIKPSSKGYFHHHCSPSPRWVSEGRRYPRSAAVRTHHCVKVSLPAIQRNLVVARKMSSDGSGNEPEPEPTTPVDAAAADAPKITEKSAGKQQQQFAKLHTVTVCMVPPPENEHVWQVVSNMRRQLQDPGYFRWPPHVNLLYPFLKPSNASKMERQEENETSFTLTEIVQKLRAATATVPPFSVRLDSFGTFGGKNRGVLWLHPESSTDGYNGAVESSGKDTSTPLPPLIALQQSLETEFPMCRDQSQKGENGQFVPHMTVSHFPSQDEALRAQANVEALLGQRQQQQQHDLQFMVDRIYLLERRGDNGQFLRVAEIALGGSNNDHATSSKRSMASAETKVLDPPRAFPGMPDKEDDWVYEERMKMKERRRRTGNRGRGGRRIRSYRNKSPRIPDTPEVIAAKRAERKAKRERLLLEQQRVDLEGDVDDKMIK